MRVKRHIPSGLFAALAAVAVIPASASADGVTAGGGPLALGPPTILNARLAGPNFVSVQQGTLAFDGTISGSGTITVAAVAHPEGFETLTADWTCTCTVGGITDTVVAHFEGTDNGTFSGTFTVQGEGALDGFHGQGTFSGADATGLGGYTLNFEG